MTKYLKQFALVRKCQHDTDGMLLLDAYGQPKYEAPVKMRCRKELNTQRGTTGQGQFVNYSTVYYFDETAQIHKGDLIDEQEIQEVEDYVLGTGVCVGQEVRV